MKKTSTALLLTAWSRCNALPSGAVPEYTCSFAWCLLLQSLALTPHQSALRRKALLMGLHCMDYCLQYEQTKHKKSENQLLASILAAIKSILHFPIVPYSFWCLHSSLTEQFYHIVRAGNMSMLYSCNSIPSFFSQPGYLGIEVLGGIWFAKYMFWCLAFSPEIILLVTKIHLFVDS